MTDGDPEMTLHTRLVGGLIRRVGLVTRAMTLGWSALFLHEQITFGTVLSACGIVICVLWALTTVISV